MKKIIIVFIVSVFCLICFFGCSNTSGMIESTNDSNTSEMIESESNSNQNEQDVVLPDVIMPNVKVGDIFEIIQFRGGWYEWHNEITPSLGLEFVSRNNVLPKPGIVGGAFAVFTFEAVATGKYIITFMYKSFVEPDELPIETLVYEITVK